MAGGGRADWMRSTICLGSEPFIFLTVFAISSHISIVPQLLLRKLCLNSYNTTICDNLDSGLYPREENLIHEETAAWNTYFFLAFSVPSIFTCGVIGLLYDTYLKTKLLLVVPVTMSLQAVVYLMSATYMNLHVGYLILGSFINSVCGDIQGSIMLAYAYMADITNKDEKRSLRMALTESSVFLGQATGSLFSGYFLQNFGFQSVFWASLAVSIANFAYVGFILPSPVSDDDTTEPQSMNISFQIRRFCSEICYGRHIKIFVPLLLAVALTNMAVLGENEILVLYLKRQPLAMMAREIGLYLGVLHFGRGLGAAINAFVMTTCFKSADFVIAMTGLVSLIFTHVAVSLVHTKTALYLTSCLSLTAPLAMSSFRSIATKTVSASHHGMALSLIAVISMVGLTVATVAANKVYQYTSKQYPGLAVLILACFSGGALIIDIIMYMREKLYQHRTMRMSAIDEPASEDEGAVVQETTPFLEGKDYNKPDN